MIESINSQLLINTYLKAKALNLDIHFIILLEREKSRRDLHFKVG
ncbi:sporulation histidine kinase inhibitor Sda [Bacillus salipaludis]|uniref:Sporulation histidine kinase inhibitor Sda n=1 Tax=Bacillus salipaludis TaxID=2547811 RepID=A0AA90TR10_9BACI|nr:sporulation histidine kinase inhibitor Sda [Bacillus salipaludis]MDQ6598876.1 sporulation histidine kinase inhibitor Sda [Bacillus salipaludis]